MTETIGDKTGHEAAPPGSWSYATVDEISEINPRYSRSDVSEKTEVSFVPMKAVEELSGRIDLSETKPVVEVKKRYTAFKEGDVLFAKITPCMENGKIAVARGLENGLGFGSTEFHVVRPHEAVSAEYLFYFLSQRDFRATAERNMTGSAGQRRVPTRYLRDVTLPIPPLNEQRRIVEKIEELFTRLDAGVEALKHARAQLKQYRQSVLNAAVTGELSRRWREAHSSEVEPASELLERILDERREKWTGKKYKEPVQPEHPPLSVLPSEWHWVSVSQITQRVTDGTHQSPTFTESGIPFVFVQHIVGGHISFENTKYISEDTYVALNSRCPVEIGDVLYSAVGSYGVAVPVKTSQPFSFQRHIAHIKPLGGLSSDFLVACLNSPLCRRQAHKAARGVAQKTVALGEIVRFQLPLPPLEEQDFIVSEVERRFSVIDRLEATIEESLKRSESLRQSILKRAFSGGLVEQDPDDEPASALLERIRKERQATEQKVTKGKKGRSKKAATAEEPSLFSGSEG